MHITIKRRRGSHNISLRVLPGGEVTVNAPYWIPITAINAFINRQSAWLTDKINLLKNVPKPRSRSEIIAEYSKLKSQAKKLATQRLDYYNHYYNFSYQRVSIRNQSSRWGSCSHSGTLSFNYRIALLEPEFRDYIIVHELCHLGQMNHSPAFWTLVSKTFPNHKKLRKLLRTKHLNLL